MSGIFISYRRQDSDAYAGRLYDRLVAHFGKARLFMDIDMDLGVDFVEEIGRRVALCDVLIAVIGRTWLDVKTEAGLRRLDDPADWVRLEIAAALGRGIPVIPTLVGGAKMPKASDLPATLSKLTRRQAIEIGHIGFHADVDRLIRGLDSTLSLKHKERAKKRPTASLGGIAEPPQTSQPTSELVYIDPGTGLMWALDDNGQDINWTEANEYATGLGLGGYADWRLPRIGELEKLYDPKDGGSYNIRRPFRLTGCWVWSSTMEAPESAFLFDFNVGLGNHSPIEDSYGSRALCVRGS